jgi:hypothetical protein
MTNKWRTSFLRKRSSFAPVLLVAATATLHACSGTTGSQRFEFQATMGGADSLPPTATAAQQTEPLVFDNEVGWTISLERATATLGPVYLNVLAPLRASLWDRLAPSGWVRSAWAGGESHQGEGRVVGEVLGQVQFDALSSTLVPFPVRGVVLQEQVRTLDLWFFPEPGVPFESASLATTALDVLGFAERKSAAGAEGKGAKVRFRGKVVLNEDWLPTQAKRGAVPISEVRKVRGIATDFVPNEGGQLQIRLDVKQIFRGADFDSLINNPVDADGTRVLVQAKTGKVTVDQVMTNIYQGLRQTEGTYRVRWVP